MRTAIVIACVLFPASAEAASLAVFDAPGAATTCGTALASDGLVAGQATAGGIGTATPLLWHGGHFSAPKLNLPPGLVYLGGVNSAHAVVGTDLTQNLQILAFSAHGSMTSTPALGRHPVLSLDGITETGTILGQVQLPVMFPKKLFNAPAFLRDAFGDVTLLDDGTGNTRPAGMNGLATAIAGTSLSQAGLRGWVYRAGQFAPVNVPGAILTFPQGVDGSGLVAGYYFSGSVTEPVLHGFTYAGGTYSTWDIPGAINTEILAVNDRGQRTGCFTDATGAVHGYLFTP